MKKISAILLVLVLAFTFTLPALAADSFTGQEKVEVTSTVEGNGTVTKELIEAGVFALVARAAAGESFIQWRISGTRDVDYEIIEGSLTTETIKIRAKNDISVVAVFTANQGSVGDSDDGDTSPESGDNIVVFAVFALISLAGALVVAKKAVKA